MSITQLLTLTQFLVDADGTRRSLVLDYHLWEELIEILEDLEDADEIRQLREAGEERLSWESVKAELRQGAYMRSMMMLGS